MKFFTKPQLQKLLENGSEQQRDKHHIPVVKLFTPDANCTWLLTEIDPDHPNIAFGLCDLGMGFPELGYIDLEELSTVRGRLGLPIERDLHFEGKYPIMVYANAAHSCECITEDDSILQQFAQKSSPINSPS
jgi:hypothetical protein